MPTSPPNHASKTYGQEAGFSLLEMIVVLAIMATMMTVVGTRMVGTIESNRFIRTAEAAVADVLIMRADAMMNGERRIFVTQSTSPDITKTEETTTLRRFDIPQDWRVEGDTITIATSGVCSGGFIAITSPEGRKAVFRLSPPKCAASRVSLSESREG